MKRNTLKIIHNSILAAVMLLLLDPRSFFGLWFHEIAGLAIAICFIFHIALNWAWIKVATLKIFLKIPIKMRVNYIMDCLLFFGFTLIIISGMAISKKIGFAWIGFDQDHMAIYRSMHVTFSMLVLIISGIHLGLHWNWVTARFKRSGKEGIRA